MKNRDMSIDLMKSILVIFMIIAHIIQFFPSGSLANLFSEYVNLTTFSGFMFTFGYVCYKAYVVKAGNGLLKRLMKGFIRTLCAYYVSGIAHTILIENEFSAETMFDIIVFERIPNYSEFLLSFAFSYFLIYIWAKFGKKMMEVHYVLITILSLLLTYINYDAVNIPLLRVLFGADNTYVCFPILQYMSFFIAGIYLASKDKVFDKKIMLLSCIGFMVFCLFFVENHIFPRRFPPTLEWIVGGYLFVYIYYILCKKFSDCFVKKQILYTIGANSLVFLVISNIVIFMFYRCISERYVYFSAFERWGLYIGIFVMCMIGSFMWILFVKKYKR